MPTIIDEYLDYHKKFYKKYGEKSLVLIQVGSFYEAYSIETEGPNLKAISDLINIVCTRKDKKQSTIDKKNPYMLGFPLISADKHISLLINNGYTLIIIDQTTPPPDPKREITNIISPGTYIGVTPTVDTNYVAMVFFEYEKQKIGQPLLCSGMSAIDVTTGKVVIYETLSSLVDADLALDNTNRFLTSIQPKEIILTKMGDGKMSLDTICEYLLLDKNKLQIMEYDKTTSKLSYQNELLKNIYSDKKNMLTPVEFLDLDNYNYARISFVNCINFLSEHNNKLINKLDIPEVFVDSTQLILGNNSIYQLNVLESDGYNYTMNNKIKSLYDVVNNASTAMGKRYIKHILLAPMISCDKIKENHDRIEKVLHKSRYLELEKLLSFINDIEKLKRKLNLNIIQPYELADYISSFETAKEIFTKCKKYEITDVCPKKETLKTMDEFIEECNKIFDTVLLKRNILNNIKTTLFKENVDKKIDELVAGQKSSTEFMESVLKHFEKVLSFLQQKNRFKKPAMDLKSTKTEGTYISMSKKRYDVLKKELGNKKNQTEINKIIISNDNLIVKELKSTVKIFVKGLNNATKDQSELDEEFVNLVYTTYIKYIGEIFTKYHKMFDVIIKNITIIDYVVSCAKTAKLYNYTKPKLINEKYGYIKAKNIRHPVVERLIDYEYVPHDIELGKDLKGMLIYGLNSSGKSVLMKAIGLCVIMAQAGMYVPARECTISPYDAIYSRITGNDNIFKGLSSFSLEMTELNAILKRANKKTLVIGDEVCRGTEVISGNAIVASTIVKLSQKETTFIFATHLHELVNIDEVKELVNVKAYHLSTEYDPKKDILIYDRLLKEGSGDTIYGITVAKYIIQDMDFMNLTNKIKNNLNSSYGKIVSGKKSKYNSDVYVYKCELCGRPDLNGEFSPLETHHINYQKDCKDGFVVDKPHIQKNAKANLVVICESCHDKIHSGELSVKGYTMTSGGKKIKT
uniref:DNA mismatch repair proteins mutS family domain-containing protein n=1 Tax=viral metagenome TaxID=1070528 RepID=A0A6C0ECV4_9ZZZZ